MIAMIDKCLDGRIAEENSADWSKGVPWLTVATAALALLLYLLAGPAASALVFDRAAVEAGQWWRLITGHLIHSDPSHLGWDLAGLLVLGWLFERQLTTRRFLVVLLFGAAAVDVWLWWGPAPLRYCGMSGFLNTLLAGGLVWQWRTNRGWLVLVVGFGAVMKIVWETLQGQALLTATAWPSVPLAHAAGFAGGILLALMWFREQARLQPRPESGR